MRAKEEGPREEDIRILRAITHCTAETNRQSNHTPMKHMFFSFKKELMFLEAKRDREMDSPIEPPEEHSPINILILDSPITVREQVCLLRFH